MPVSPGRSRKSTQGRSTAREVLIEVREYLGTEAIGGIVLVGATCLALLWANLPLGDSYEDFWHSNLSLGIGDWSVSRDLRHWVSEGLMAMFFFVVALETKRELLVGKLRGARKAALPVIGAVGGMVVPALLFLVINIGEGGTAGWAIPTATDIAFAVGVVALVAPNLPQAAKVFLLSLAIVDDVGAILIIGLVYSAGVSWGHLAVASCALLLIIGLRRAGLHHWLFFLALGLIVWLATLESGVHATIAGVALGFVTPVRRSDDEPSAGERLEDMLHPWTSFLVIPVFALANAGLEITSGSISDSFGSKVTLGVLVGLVIGKPLGISLAVALATRLGVGEMPEGTRARDMVGLGAIAGIGFTVSLFIADLAFEDGARVREATVGIAAASILAATIGGIILQRVGHGRGKIKQ